MIKTNQPLVSIVVPCLNRAHFLKPTVDSILQQDYPNIECIVVDGGSTDQTIEILKSYGNRIKWISEPDNGHADAINKGWKMSKGEILAWLNADDCYVIPDAVRKAVDYLQNNPDVDVVYGDCGSIDKDGNIINKVEYFPEWNLEYAVKYCHHCIPQPASFIRRRILEKVGWLDTTFISKKDHELWLRIGLAGIIHYIPVLIAYYRKCPGYLDHRGDITAKACVDLTRKFFNNPNLPNNLKRLRRRALSNAYLQGAADAWCHGGYLEEALKYIWLSVINDLSNLPYIFKKCFPRFLGIFTEIQKEKT